MFTAVVMGDVEQGHSVNVLHSDNRIFVAVVAAIVLTTSSALIYRTKHLATPGIPGIPGIPMHPVLNATVSFADPSSAEKQDSDAQPSEKVSQEHGDATADLSSNNNEEAARDSKSSRSKERRRRGKDPMKEIMKSGKKFKGLPKTSRPNTADTDASGGLASSSGSVSGSAVMRTVQLDAPQSSNESHTRSSSSSNESTKMSPQGPSDTPERPVHADVERQSEASHPTSSFQPTPSVAPEFTDFHENNFQVDSPNTPDMLSSSADSASLISASVLKPSIVSPLASDNPHDAHHIPSSQSLPFLPTPAFGSDNRIANKPQNPAGQSFHGPWDWDSQLTPNPPSNSDVNYRKPPRFRSKSRIANSGSVSPMPASKSYSIPYNSSYSPVSNASTSSSPSISLSPIPDTEGSFPSFTFPTLNSPSPSSSPGPSSNIIQHSYMNTNGSVNGHTPRRVPTPSRTPTGSTDSGASLSLSTQTQIASLKGALEAARMREEKFKLEAERYSKECEMLKWKWGEETVAWRHAQAELQTQVVHLMHQLQGYISAFTPPPNSPAHLQVSNTNQPFPSRHLHSPSPQQSPHISTHVQMHATNSQTHPPRSHSPFFAYQGQNPNPNQQLSQPNLLALFPGGASSGGPASASGSSSVESTSPQLDTFPFWDRGRRRTRTIRSGDVDEDWLVTDGHGDLDFRTGTDETNDFNDVLADAILKRPESIRVRATRPERQETEFTFPTISNFGSADRNKEVSGKLAGGPESREDSILPKDTISNRNISSGREEPFRAG